MVVDINFRLVINTGFHSDLLNRSSEKFTVMERNITSKASKLIYVSIRHTQSSVVSSALARAHSERRWKDLSLFNLIKNDETTFSLQINIQFNESSPVKIYEVRVLSFR